MAHRPARHCDRFPSRSEMINGQLRRVRVIHCSKCGWPGRLLENTSSPLPPEVLARKFAAKGWSLGGCNVCPRCQQGKRPMSPASRAAAFCRINGVARATQTPPKPELKPMPATAARTASPEERRRVRDALDEHYDEEAGRYRQSFSDKALAAKLDVPAKWVADLREANGYGPDLNEAAEVRSAQIDALVAEVAKLQTDLLTRFDDLERKVRRLAMDDGRIE